jgi:asparagine synthase (glutamine-hydrolysing)
MCAVMEHRGPDDRGLDVRDDVGLGMRRLSVIDLSTGHQPVFNEDQTVRVVFNGEIYNYRELRAELLARGHVFRTQSDTEVIVHAYEEFGTDFAGRLNGMFAICLHDLRRRRLVLARDPVGIKPLYYALDADRFVAGSEVKVLLASGRVARDLDVDALRQLLAWEYVPWDRTLMPGIRRVPPAHLLELDLADPAAAARATPRRYWDAPHPDAVDAARSVADWEDAVDAKARECVQRQLVSDVPLGAFLSGGVDSSLVVSAMGPATTFSIGFEDPSYNELRWSKRVADHLGVEHVTETLAPDIVDLFHRLMVHLDDPIGDFSIFPTYLVSRLARRRVTVALSGDGGDELFAGYETHLAQALARRSLDALPGGAALGRALARIQTACAPRAEKKGWVNKTKRLLEGAGLTPALGHARWRCFADDRLARALFTPDAWARVHTPLDAHVRRLFAEAGDRDWLNRCLYVDLNSYLCDNCLAKVDRMSMAVSLESRVPLLDKEMVELAFRMPGALKLRGGETKALLRRVAARHVPPECVYRPKEGFSIPIKRWLLTTLKPLMVELLAEPRLRAEGLFRPETVSRLMAEHLAERANHSHVLWTLMVFQAWRGAWLENRR